ncbi:MAG: RNA 2',3'-cyclic phosphodiesterase [Patescibacteria group bacterium]
MKKKIFIAINLPESVKNKLISYTESDNFALLPVKWIEKENFHIIIEFLGYADDESILKIIERLHDIDGELDSFDFTFNKITVWPTKEEPKMIVASGEEDENLNELGKKIIDALEDIYLVKKGKKYKFKAHISLGIITRATASDFIMEDKDIKISVPVDSIDLVESFKEGNKTKYATLENIVF